MKIIYEAQITAICPTDEQFDVYDAIFESTRVIEVEDIVAAAKDMEREKAYQETITTKLARRLQCKVTTVGWHSGIKTTVIVP